MNYRLVLASQSPRRKELLSWLDVPFEVIPSSIEEDCELSDPEELVCELAYQKAWDVWNHLQDDHAFVIGSDTLVFVEKEVLGKPKDASEAEKMLRKLSGKTHSVRTAVCFIFKENPSDAPQKVVFSDHTFVRFSEIGDRLLKRYLSYGESFDKAGAYGIQGKSLSFISELKGSYSNVVGFPLSLVVEKLCFHLGEDWFEKFNS